MSKEGRFGRTHLDLPRQSKYRAEGVSSRQVYNPSNTFLLKNNEKSIFIISTKKMHKKSNGIY
jgi:hypothetical protein